MSKKINNNAFEKMIKETLDNEPLTDKIVEYMIKNRNQPIRYNDMNIIFKRINTNMSNQYTNCEDWFADTKTLGLWKNLDENIKNPKRSTYQLNLKVWPNLENYLKKRYHI